MSHALIYEYYVGYGDVVGGIHGQKRVNVYVFACMSVLYATHHSVWTLIHFSVLWSGGMDSGARS